MSSVRVIVLVAAFAAALTQSSASAAECSNLVGNWVTYRMDLAGNPEQQFGIHAGSRLSLFNSSPGGLFNPSFIVTNRYGRETQAACTAAPGGVSLIMGALPLTSQNPGSEVYVLIPGDLPMHDMIELNGISYHRR